MRISEKEFIGKGFIFLGIVFILLSVSPYFLYLIVFVTCIAIILYGWESNSVWFKAIALVVGLFLLLTIWGIFSSSIQGLLFAGSIFTMIDSYVKIIETLEKQRLFVIGIILFITGFILKSKKLERKNFFWE